MRCMICKVCCKGPCCRIETVCLGQRRLCVVDSVWVMSGLSVAWGE